MIEFIKENEQNYERALIIEPINENDNEIEKREEIEALVDSSTALRIKTISQRIREITPATYIGEGKLKEIKNYIESENINLVVFDEELSPSQQNNVSKALGDVKVITRTTLILDLFASSAVSDEGKLLVELAQLKYIYPRLKGKGINLSRLGGGIGTRGPGETKLETDRRHIKTRINYLENRMFEIEKRRKEQRNRREHNYIKTVAIVGYTNTGKSTLLNLLASSNVLVKDKYFATLDPTARKTLINGFNVVFVDTVGFVKNLPHDLISAFKSTLEGAIYSNLILLVCDASSNWQMQLETTKNTLLSLNANAEIVTVINKCDKIIEKDYYPNDAVLISAKKNIGIESLKQIIIRKLFNNLIFEIKTLKYSIKFNINKLKPLCEKIETEYLDDKIIIKIWYYQMSKEKINNYFNNLN